MLLTNTARRKVEIEELKNIMNGLNEREKIVFSTASFPRLYSHYEKFIKEIFFEVINNIYDKNVKFEDLKPKISSLIISLYSKERSVKNIIKDNESGFLTVPQVERKTIENRLGPCIHMEINYLTKIFEMENSMNTAKFTEMKLAFNLLVKKYKARNDVAHGEEECEVMEEDWIEVKNKILKIFDLATVIFEDYITNKEYEI